MSVADTVDPSRVAESFPDDAAATGIVVTVKVADVPPARTLTDEGTVARLVFDERPTEIPVLGAGPVRVTVPVDLVPPTTLAGLSVRPLKEGGSMVRVPVAELLPKVAVTMTGVDAPIAVVVAVKVAELAPAGKETLAGTITAEEAEVNITVAPPGGAAAVSPMVPVDVVPPTTEGGENAKFPTPTVPKTRFTNPEKIIAPHPEAVSQPGPATEVWLFGKVPLEPDTTS